MEWYNQNKVEVKIMNEKFCLTIEYDKTSANPEQVFYGVGKMLEAMKHDASEHAI